MAHLHAALKSLAPITFSDLPTDESKLDSWLADVFEDSQTILDSIPIAEPSSHSTGPKSSSTSIASKASEIVASSARPPPPSPEHQALQKEWGKPLKLGAKESALGMSVYKLSAKDGRGAWFARHSVHEGLPFARFKKALEMEFPESLAVQGAPGEGNVRGIGGETKVEDIKSSRGRVEVYRLSAQFPGPTAPRDFITMLVTSEGAIKGIRDGDPVPRHYMIVSKPCDHPETQPQNGFTRGYYESIEFIREVPRPIETSQSTSDHLNHVSQVVDITRDAMIRNANQKAHTFSEDSTAPEVTSDLGRKRSTTEPGPLPALKGAEEALPVEWIMITRSDPGGSVPRFMVERGTPSSICADAEKFLNWACKQDFDDQDVTNVKDIQAPVRQKLNRESFSSFRSSRVAGVEDDVRGIDEHANTGSTLVEKETADNNPTAEQQSGGLIGAISGAAQYLTSYTPQIVRGHLPGGQTADPEQSHEQSQEHLDVPEREDDDAVSTAASFESADSHLATNESIPASPTSSRISMPRKSEEHLTHHEKELLKLEKRRTALYTKFSESRTKLEREADSQTVKDETAKQKAAEKHEKEVQKQKEKYERELKKLEDKQEKERKKIEEKMKKQLDKDEKAKLTRERNEAREELEIAKKEASVLRNAVEELQRENTTLVAKLGKATSINELSGSDSHPSSKPGSPRAPREKQ